MERLGAELLEKGLKCKREIVVGPMGDWPEKVLQFGEGNFLRGFAEWMINEANRKGSFGGKVVIVQPIEAGLVDVLNEQDGLYTLLLRGIENGQAVERTEVITCVSRGINPYVNWGGFLDCAANPDLRFVISNTTEAGIVYVQESRPVEKCAKSFPAKLTEFLYRRYRCFAGAEDKGMVIIPCELIDRNGDNLKKCVLKHCKDWGLEGEFSRWIEACNHFLNTLVDRIVSGYPRDEIEAITDSLGYEDRMLVAGEIFSLWVIEAEKRFDEELGFIKAGLNVVWCDDLRPFRERKVRILNGAHTMTAPMAYLYGKDTIRECMEDVVIKSYIRKGLFGEIVPGLDLPGEEKEAFAEAVLERFSNPYIKHNLLSICLNSVSKFKVRVLGSLLEYVEREGRLPKILSFSLACLIAFYRGSQIHKGRLLAQWDGKVYQVQDEAEVLEFFAESWGKFEKTGEVEALCRKVLANRNFWGRDLNEVNGLAETVSGHIGKIITEKMCVAVRELI